MAGAMWNLDASQGELLLRTDVSGRAAKMGHRLTITMTSWQAGVSWDGDQPCAVHLTVEVDSLRVLRGDGGLTPLSAPEKTLVRSNALTCLEGARHPRIRFHADDITRSDDGYRLAGTLEIRGRAHPHEADLRVTDLGDSWRMQCDTALRQSEYGVKRYSLLMGSVRVADTVLVSFDATHAKDGRGVPNTGGTATGR